MLDGTRTSIDWQVHTGTVCVLPIGSFEQHGEHMPLSTDIIGAEFFARMIADDLGATLLPVLPFGTCMEHNGFRGSVSLRPETLMQILRDIAGEMESQNFKRLILLNGHGGNFALGPAARDWNRQDRSLKILHVNFWEYWDDNLAADSRNFGIEVHAGEKETSIMLAIRPDLVQMDKLSSRQPNTSDPLPLVQRDLNTFGMGHFDGLGIIGEPSSATAEKGHALIESVRTRMLPFVRDRLRRLDEQPLYSGKGGIAIRTMQLGDLADALRLTAAIGWNQTAADWQLFLEENPNGCYVAVRNGHVVGTTTTIYYGDNLAWISMVLVDPELRRLGIGRRLLLHALEALKDCAVVKLDATPKGQELYEKLGFTPEYSLKRWIHPSLPRFDAPADNRLRPIVPDDMNEVAQGDEREFGAPRAALLETLLSNDPARAWCLKEGSAITGFCLGRPGRNFHQLGPINSASFEDAQLLARAALHTLQGQPIGLDVPNEQAEFTSWLQQLGFVEQRPFLRMSRRETVGEEVSASAQQFAICGPEFG